VRSTNLASTGEESTPGSAYYIEGSNGKALVNSRVSGAVFDMISAAKNTHVSISATSAFRAMTHQTALCDGDPSCKSRRYTSVAKPGTSNHQMGLAIDFAETHVKGGTSCSAQAVDPGNPTWRWLHSNAAAYEYRQYAAESWHWDPTSGPAMC
jgi:LAS superfamily LD-carboxypeptidase LdcB